MNLDIPFTDSDIIALDDIVQRIVSFGANIAWIRWPDGDLLVVAEADGEADFDADGTTAQARVEEVIVGAKFTSRFDLDALAAVLGDVDRVFAPYRREPLHFRPAPDGPSPA